MLYVSRDLIEKMDSGSHFATEVPMNMTGLAEILTTVSDKVFTVRFKKQPSVESASEKLAEYSFKDIKDAKKRAQITKEIVEGKDCEMTCHLINTENNLGRSTVIDLSATSENKFR